MARHAGCLTLTFAVTNSDTTADIPGKNPVRVGQLLSRKREKESERERMGESVCVYVCVCVCVCVRERESVCVWERKSTSAHVQRADRYMARHGPTCFSVQGVAFSGRVQG